jgi:hypothetical protein
VALGGDWRLRLRHSETSMVWRGRREELARGVPWHYDEATKHGYDERASMHTQTAIQSKAINTSFSVVTINRVHLDNTHPIV